MELSIKNHIALITGASQGIGEAIAKQLAKEGAAVAITSNDLQNLERVAAEIRELGGDVFMVSGDVHIPEDIHSIVKAVYDHFGAIDILINNIGVTGRVIEFQELEDHEWFDVFTTNIMSGVRFTQAVLPQMKQKNWGRVIFMASEFAIQPRTEMPHYAMTKAGVLSITKSLANTLGKYNITVNSVSPGVILTPAFDLNAATLGITRETLAMQCSHSILDQNRIGMPKDVANLVCYLCSKCANWITGSNFRVDGGSVACI